MRTAPVADGDARGSRRPCPWCSRRRNSATTWTTAMVSTRRRPVAAGAAVDGADRDRHGGRLRAHRDHRAGRPANAEPLAEVGRLFGRIAHARRGGGSTRRPGDRDVEPAARDRYATASAPAGPGRGGGYPAGLREADLTDRRLVHALLVHELDHAIGRTFAGSIGTGIGTGIEAGSDPDYYPPVIQPGRRGSRASPGPTAAVRAGSTGATAPPVRRGVICSAVVSRAGCAAPARSVAVTRIRARGEAVRGADGAMPASAATAATAGVRAATAARAATASRLRLLSAPRRLSALSTTSCLVVYQNGGRLARRNEP